MAMQRTFSNASEFALERTSSRSHYASDDAANAAESSDDEADCSAFEMPAQPCCARLRCNLPKPALAVRCVSSAFDGASCFEESTGAPPPTRYVRKRVTQK